MRGVPFALVAVKGQAHSGDADKTIRSLNTVSLAAIALEAESLQIIECIGPTLSYRNDMVNFEFYSRRSTQAAPVSISLEDEKSFSDAQPLTLPD